MNNKFNFDELYKLIDIVAVISSKVSLKKKGTNYWGLCPFHTDSNPSMSVSSTKAIFKCFSCGASGNAVSFLQKINNVNFFSALKEALELSHADIEIINSLNDNVKLDINQKIYLLNKQAMLLMNNYLLMEINNKLIHEFLNKRNITLNIINKFNLGYIDETKLKNFYDNLYNYCLENFKDEIPDDLLKKTNLFLFDENKKENYLFFNQRLIFPIFDKLSNVIGFSGRDITSLSKAKYINSIESKEFIKGNNLYNYNSLNVIDTNDEIIIVEGYMDAITLVNNDFVNTVATMGTALTLNQLKLIFYIKNLKKIILSFDNDDAGKHAFIKNLNIILDYEKTLNNFIPIYISGLMLSKYKDPDELFKNINKKDASDIFSKYQNALFISAKFMLEFDSNLEYSLNITLKYLIQYESSHFGIYVNNALELFINYLVTNYSLNKKTINDLIDKLRENKKFNIKQSTFKNNYNNKIIKFESPQEFDKKLINKLSDDLSLLNKQYNYIILFFLYNPFKASKFKYLYLEENLDKNILNDDSMFREIIKKINRLKLIDYIENEEYQNFLKYGFLLYLYIDNLDLDQFKENDFVFNFNVLNNSLFFENLKDDKTFSSAIGLKNYLSNNSLTDFKKNEKILKLINQETFYFNLLKVFLSIWEILVDIYKVLNLLKKSV